MSVEKYKLGSATTVHSTGLNSLANNGLVTPVAYDNTQAAAGDGYSLVDVELVVTFGVAPTANTNVAVWFLGAPDGTNYEDGDSSTTPGRAPDVTLPVRAVTTAQRAVQRVTLPAGLLKVLPKNNGTGQAFAASGNTIKIRPVTREGA